MSAYFESNASGALNEPTYVSLLSVPVAEEAILRQGRSAQQLPVTRGNDDSKYPWQCPRKLDSSLIKVVNCLSISGLSLAAPGLGSPKREMWFYKPISN